MVCIVAMIMVVLVAMVLAMDMLSMWLLITVMMLKERR